MTLSWLNDPDPFNSDHTFREYGFSGVRHCCRCKASKGSDVRSNSNLASGLKSRPRNCPYTLVARRSGVRVIEGREFLNGKDAGRNASEPRSSLVN